MDVTCNTFFLEWGQIVLKGWLNKQILNMQTYLIWTADNELAKQQQQLVI